MKNQTVLDRNKFSFWETNRKQALSHLHDSGLATNAIQAYLSARALGALICMNRMKTTQNRAFSRAIRI